MKWSYTIQVRDVDVLLEARKGTQKERKAVPKGKALVATLKSILSKYETDEEYVAEVIEYVKTFNPKNITIEPKE